ncbi:hypothetical protein [Winogradskyella poriferorum]|uniref:hypothetical protein n=1 Tax=Winogradskyella poriferorum TaxID=307627 RepID=UPI003D65188A
MESDDIYKIIDLTLKVILGIIVVIYIHNRNVKSKKKEILYDLFSSIVESYQFLKINFKNVLHYEIFDEIFYLEKRYATNFVLNTLESTLKEFEISTKEFQKHLNDFKKNLETLELIIGIKENDKKWNEARQEIQYIYVQRIDVNEPLREKLRKDITGLVQTYETSVITEYELQSEIEDLISAYITPIYWEFEKESTLKGRHLLKMIKKKIDRL